MVVRSIWMFEYRIKVTVKLTMSIGFSAMEVVESFWVHDILLGMFKCFEVNLKADQNFSLFDFSKDGSF